jgi:hypothetical protein
MNRQKLLAPILMALGISSSASGCSHSYRLSGFDLGAGLRGTGVDQLLKRSPLRVAVILGEPGIRSAYQSSADGHTFIFLDTDRFYAEGYRSLLGPHLASLDFHSAPPTAGYDFYLYPSVDLTITAAFVTKKCTVQHALVVVDSKAREIYRGSETAANQFTVIDTAEHACKLSVFGSFTAPMSGAIGAMVAEMIVPSRSPAELSP